jgi:hypothetical protein
VIVTHRDPEAIGGNWDMDVHFLELPNAHRPQLDLFYDYRKNVALSPVWQAILPEHRLETLNLWDQNDVFFTMEGGGAYLGDLPNAELIRLDAGQFPVEDSFDQIVGAMNRFHAEHVAGNSVVGSF